MAAEALAAFFAAFACDIAPYAEPTTPTTPAMAPMLKLHPRILVLAYFSSGRHDAG